MTHGPEVFLLIHDDRSYDMGDTYVRGVYATEAAATEALVTRTASGARSRAWSAHTENCCSVDPFTVESAAVADIREDDPPLTGVGLLPGAFAEEAVRFAGANAWCPHPVSGTR